MAFWGTPPRAAMDALLCAIGRGTMLFCAETGGEREKAGIPPLAWSNGRGASSPGAAADGFPYWLYEWPLAGRLQAFGCCISPRLARGWICGGQECYGRISVGVMPVRPPAGICRRPCEAPRDGDCGGGRRRFGCGCKTGNPDDPNRLWNGRRSCQSRISRQPWATRRKRNRLYIADE